MKKYSDTTAKDIVQFHLEKGHFGATQFRVPNRFQSVPFLVQQRIGNNSSYGKVFELHPMAHNAGMLNKTKMFVAKFIEFGNKSVEKSFDREVLVGSTPGIEKVGPRIFASMKTKEYGIYIMDNLMKGLKDYKLVSLYAYLNKHYRNTCPGRNSQLYIQLQQVLRNFYKLGYYHGDLHFNNIGVLHTNVPGKKKIILRLFDYGSAQILAPLSVNINTACIETILMQVHEQFLQKCEFPETYSYTNGNMKTAETAGTPFRSNAYMVRNSLGGERYESFIKTAV